MTILDYDMLIPTHNLLRSMDSFFKIKEIICSDESQTIFQKPIKVLSIEDKFYLNDGHHRVCAASFSRAAFSNFKVNVETYTYEQLMEINFSCGWVTPYNPRTHVRTNNCRWFKDAVLNIKAGSSEYATEWAISAIRNYGPKAYMEERKIWTIQELLDISLSQISQ